MGKFHKKYQKIPIFIANFTKNPRKSLYLSQISQKIPENPYIYRKFHKKSQKIPENPGKSQKIPIFIANFTKNPRKSQKILIFIANFTKNPRKSQKIPENPYIYRKFHKKYQK